MMTLTADEKKALLHALDKIETTLGREEVGDLRDVIRVVVAPDDPKSKKFIEYQLWDIENDTE
jgi:hypothetical protein